MKSSIRLSLGHDSILAGLQILNKLGISTLNRSYSSCFTELIQLTIQSQISNGQISLTEPTLAKETLNGLKNSISIENTLTLTKDSTAKKTINLTLERIQELTEETQDIESKNILKGLFDED